MKKDHFEIVLEDINSKFDVLIENQDVVIKTAAKVDGIEQDVREIKLDLTILKYAIKTHENDISHLKTLHPNMSHN